MDPTIQKQLVDGLGEIKAGQKTLLENYDRLDAATKKSAEDFDKAVKRLDSIEDVQRSLQKLQANLHRESRAAFADPARRIAMCEEKRAIMKLNIIRGLSLEDRLSTKQKDYLNGLRRDLNEGADPGDTYIANPEIERDIYDLLSTYGAFRELDARSIGAKATQIRLKTARAAAFFVDEAAAIGADSTKAGTKVTVTPSKIGCLLTASSELLEDDITGVIEDILNDMAEAHAYRTDWIAFAATGNSDNVDGGFTGMFAGGTDIVAASGHTSIAAITYDDILALMTNATTATLQRGNAKWFLNQNILAKFLGIKDGNNRPIFQSMLEAPSYGALGTIIGRPVVPVAVAPSTDGTSKRLAAFGDPNNLGVRIRRDVRFDRSDHYAFDTDEITFRSTSRVAAKVKLATGFTVLKTAAS